MLSLLIFVVVVGLIVWLVTLLPIPAPFNQIGDWNCDRGHSVPAIPVRD
jgi:hypothetical protein